MATDIRTWDEFIDAVRVAVRAYDPEMPMPSETELRSYWNTYRSVEDTARDWIDYCEQ